MKYEKPAFTNHELLNHWKSRGLVIPDRIHADKCIRFMGYYRLSVYARYFRRVTEDQKPFKPGTRFEDITRLYHFDRDLRLLTMDAIERIEVAVRSVMVGKLSNVHDPFWYRDGSLFKTGIPDPGVVKVSKSTGLPLKPLFVHADLIKKIEEYLYIDPTATVKAPTRGHNEEFIKHYYRKYGEPYLPPSWMVAEILTLGDWSRMFEHLKETHLRKAIAVPFREDESVLTTWLQAFTHLRNFCAHHGRIWNRKFVMKPTIAARHTGFLKSNDTFYALAVALFALLLQIHPETDWNHRLAALLAANPSVDLAVMGFPADWMQEPFWKLAPAMPDYEI